MELKHDILGPEDIIKHATEVSKRHTVGKSIKFPKSLLSGLDKNYRYIFDVYISLNQEAEEESSLSSASEWLLDNIYIIEEQVKEIKQILSKKYCFRLPVLKNGEFKGYPRVYVLALEIVAHTDGNINENSIISFLKAYQSQQPLLMSELWALAIMFRMALIEKISRVCEELKVYNQQRHEAKRIAKLIISDIGKSNCNLHDLINKQVWDKAEIDASFLEVLIGILRKRGQVAAEAIGYIDQELKTRGMCLENLINTEHQLQASRQVSIGNAITGLRSIAAIDWNEPFETLSHIEEILRQDPSGDYGRMDFESRDYYRHIVEKISRAYNISEIKIAQKALNCAKESSAENGDPMQHIGYYLISTGREKLEKELKVRPSIGKNFYSFFKQFPQEIYFSLISIVSILIITMFLAYSITQEVLSPLSLLLVVLVLLIPVSEISINIVNYIISHLYSPVILPKLELRDGISQENNTMVIIPSLLPDSNRAKEIVKKLEGYYLANKEKNLYFSLVGDFKDSTSPETGNETEIMDTALKGIAELNHRYSMDKPIFYYFHRKRQYNHTHNLWMGWERKRGAIVELNDLLRGSKDTSFNTASCEPDEIPDVKYVITLDADTKLPIDAAKRLIGAMAHPLNKPVIDIKKGVTVRGYGILQPRIGISLDSANQTIFSRIFAGQGGIDPYTTAVSDVYQDLFGEGIFTGKGIYEIDTFQSLLKEALPENSVLSHDLLEGSYVRAGLVTDIELIDGYPARYNSFSMRQHRWVRGDWQLIPWLTASPISTLSKWKILDNLRRSLLNPSLFMLISLGFFMLPGPSLIWLGLAVITLSFPIIAYLCQGILDKTNGLIESNNDQTIITGIKSRVYQTTLQFIFIPYQTLLMMDAVLRTLIRVFITRKNLLEWTPAADLDALLKNDLSTYFKNMIISPISGVLVLGLAIIKPGTNLEVLLATLVSGAWIIAPYLAYRISQDYKKEIENLAEEEKLELRKLARKTWAYFEDFVSAKDNYLPPDNYQVDPPNGIAHRTSPTNIGLSLVCTLAARDFGYIGTAEMIERLNNTLATIEKMEKWEGHLYNWYDTKSLQILAPRFVSTVDSGNFISYLMVLEKGLEEYLNRSAEDPAFAKGLLDTIALLNEELNQVERVINTKILDEFLAIDKGHHHWEEVLESIQLQLAKDELKEQIKNSHWGTKILTMIEAYRKEVKVTKESILRQGEELLKKINLLIENTKFLPLFDSKRQLFSIGYSGDGGFLIKSYYDLLASEARIASYIAIARGEVAKKHWFRLGRKLTRLDNHKGLVSWTGTMFEYLMPLLVMRNFKESLLDETYSFVVQTQEKYGLLRAVPWGISESGYHAFDVALNYQYKAFGVPQIGFKRGLDNDLVVAPYASVLALMINPKGAYENILRLKEAGLDGEYGLYEAIDYTPERTALHGESAIVKSFMVHHQGMSLLALSNIFSENIMQRRFHANPFIRSAEELLQERVPSKVSIIKEHKEAYKPLRRKTEEKQGLVRQFELPDWKQPNVQLLSNGNYSVMVTDSGFGYSRNKDIAVARWLEKPGNDNLGFFIYVQNINSNNVWSATFAPFNDEPESYRVVFSPDKAEFIRTDGNIETHTQIVISPEDNAEIRTVTLTNNSQHSRIVEVTSYLEVVLAHADADLAHPAFSNLFVTTEFVQQYDCLLATRRPRSAENKPLYAIHTINVEGEVIGDLQYETDRSKFIGRNRGLANPLAMDVDQPLSNSVGAVLDPVMSLRRRVKIKPGHTIRISYTLAMTENREEALILADKYRDPKVIDRAFELAWNRSRIEAGYLDIEADDMDVYSRLVSSIMFTGPARLKYKEITAKNKKGQSGLWPFGISGDLPLVLVHLNNKEQIDIVIDLLKAHEFWQLKGLKVDLVFMAEDESGYVQPLQDSIRDAISASHARDLINQKSGVFLLNVNVMEDDEKNMIYAVARIVFRGDNGSIKEQLKWEEAEFAVPMLKTADNCRAISKEMMAFGVSKFDPSKLDLFNGFGGFSKDGMEYVINLKEGLHTPAPWINVIANNGFGFNVSEVGSGYTWAENSRENKLTPWYNDPVSDPLGEVFYLRDEQVGDYWNFTAMPIREEEDYIIRHGQGYTTFEHTSHSIEQQLTQFVAVEDPVKISLIKLKNLSGVAREISVTYYMRPVLGVNEKVSTPYITTKSHEDGTLLITNSYNSDFPGRIAFIDTSEASRTFTGDNHEFIGNQGSLKSPLAMKREELSGKVGAGLTPCGTMQIKVTLAPNETKEMVFLLGQGSDLSEAISLARKYRAVDAAQVELNAVKAFWQKKLGAIQVTTPDKSMDLLLNGWLQYQVVSCRLWSRAAFYQSGGAFGFRDQLQDVMATVYTWPELTRKQILLHSAHQFIEGDVQHWWHPGADKGIRTRYSDDLLWLPFVTADYIEATADWSILEEVVGFLEDEPLPYDEDERYSVPRISDKKDTVYVHCTKAIERALKFGVHGLPLMGSGDWNDGMNKVGNLGKGESVWLAWFLYKVLQRFIPICKARGDEQLAEKYLVLAANIAEAIEKNAWDGSWYRRAYFDDGTPLGSAENIECKIDAIAQSWSVISGIGKAHRAEEAMRAVENYLIDREAGIIKLLTPPFGDGDLQPGYIKGYVPGVRENGGQYTHAAVWTIMAFAMLGYGNKASEFFSLVNPINHALTTMDAIRYKVEPYVLSADVYAVFPNTGRGGWSWYTGAAGWMYRVGIEHILGLKKVGKELRFNPCIPKEWESFEMEYHFLDTVYRINIKNPCRVSKGVKETVLDKKIVSKDSVALVNDGKEHIIEVKMG